MVVISYISPNIMNKSCKYTKNKKLQEHFFFQKKKVAGLSSLARSMDLGMQQAVGWF